MREAVMDYAACNVVYVDRTAQEDKLVKREDATSTASTAADDAHNYADGYAPTRTPRATDDNLRTLLGTFSEGTSRSLHALIIELTSYSPCLYIRQILHIETVRIESSLHCRTNTYPRPHRYPLRRSTRRTTIQRNTDTFSKFEASN